MATQKFESCYDLFMPMAEFAIRNGMNRYFSDLMHDAVEVYEMEKIGTPYKLVFAARTTGCGTDCYTPNVFNDLEEHGIFDPNRPKAIIEYDGEFFYFTTED